MYGTRFSGIPIGSSPIRDVGCAPIGLKYLREILLHELSPIKISHFCLVSPYGDSAFLKEVFSSTGNFSGVP